MWHSLKQYKREVNMPTDIYDELAAAWPAPIVARREVGRFSGGVLNPRSMSNLDSLGLGPPRLKIGEKTVAYPTKSLVAWMRDRAQQK
jgi:hypothetical protein